MPVDKEQSGARYKIFGPFPFTLAEGEKHRAALTAFWKRLDGNDQTKGLSSAIGVYVWTHLEDGKRIPWNVGLTSKQGFKSRFFQKKASYLELALGGRATDVEVYLVARLTSGGKFKKPTASERISSNEWLETQLISAALAVNPQLRNVSKTQKQKTVIVEGFLNDPFSNGDKAAKSLSKILKVKS